MPMPQTHHQNNGRVSRKSVKKLTFLAFSASFAIILSYVESLLPFFSSIVPWIKIGLPNIVTVYLLYLCGTYNASMVSLVRVLMISILFGSPMSAAYSLCGAAVSLTLMALLKKFTHTSVAFVSIVGAVFHNISQLILFLLISHTEEILVYLPILTAGGILSGLVVGVSSSLLLKYLNRSKLIKSITET